MQCPICFRRLQVLDCLECCLLDALWTLNFSNCSFLAPLLRAAWLGSNLWTPALERETFRRTSKGPHHPALWMTLNEGVLCRAGHQMAPPKIFKAKLKELTACLFRALIRRCFNWKARSLFEILWNFKLKHQFNSTLMKSSCSECSDETRENPFKSQILPTFFQPFSDLFRWTRNAWRAIKRFY